MNKNIERLYVGIFKENPIFVMMLGMCPTLAVTTSTENAIGMGLSTTAVLVFSNLIIAIMRNVIPEGVRLPSFIVIVASLVTIVDLLMEGFTPALSESLGVYIPLIVVNCIILGRAEAYASKNPPILSLFDGIGMGLGFTVALVAIGFLRELIATGSVFGNQIIPSDYSVAVIGMAPGAFFIVSILTALQNKFQAPSATNRPKKEGESEGVGCDGNCGGCATVHASSDKEDKA